jgi:predicted nucleic acid-binding protein
VSYLLDTNVLSEARKPNANPNVAAWYSAVERTELYMSALAVGEVRRGAELLRRRDQASGEVFDTWLARLQREYSGRILPVTETVADLWGRLMVPDPLPILDGLMAATALVHDMTFVTRNVADIERTGVRLLNPFEA